MFPALASSRISRVVATFSDSRNSVSSTSSDGNTDRSMARVALSVTSSSSVVTPRFIASSPSSSIGGSGTSITTIPISMAADSIISLCCSRPPPEDDLIPGCDMNFAYLKL